MHCCTIEQRDGTVYKTHASSRLARAPTTKTCVAHVARSAIARKNNPCDVFCVQVALVAGVLHTVLWLRYQYLARERKYARRGAVVVILLNAAIILEVGVHGFQKALRINKYMVIYIFSFPGKCQNKVQYYLAVFIFTEKEVHSNV